MIEWCLKLLCDFRYIIVVINVIYSYLFFLSRVFIKVLLRVIYWSLLFIIFMYMWFFGVGFVFGDIFN